MDKVALLQELEVLVGAKRKVSGRDLERFPSIYLKNLTPIKAPPFHKDILKLLSEFAPQQKHKGEGGSPLSLEENNSNDPTNFSPQISNLSSNQSLTRLLVIAPRGFAKSTLCAVAFPLWLALYGLKKDIFVVSATISLAKEHLRRIRSELENNPLILQDFGDLKSDKWTEDMLVLKDGTTIRAKGRGFQIRGFRPDMIVCDDLEDEEVLYSKEQREKLETWFFRTLMPSLKPDQGLLYVGTKLHQLALIGKLEQKEEFVSRHYKALTDGKSIWEDYWPTEKLEKLRKELGTYAFEAEYQNNPLSLSSQPIKPHYLEGVRIQGKPIVSCLAIDPAISEKESADFRAIAIFERTDEGFREKYSEHGRWGIDEQVDRVISLYEQFSPNRVIIEEVAFQKVFRDILTKKARSKGLYIPITEAFLGKGDDKRPKDKMTRLLEVVHLFEQRTVQINNPELREELLAFPLGDYDDMVDATVYALQWLLSYREGGFKIKKEEVKLISGRPSMYMKEVKPGIFLMTPGEPPIVPQKKNFFNFNK